MLDQPEFFDLAVEFAEERGVDARPHKDFGARFTIQDKSGRYFFDVEAVNRFTIPPESKAHYADRVMKVLGREYANAVHSRRVAMLQAERLFAVAAA